MEIGRFVPFACNPEPTIQDYLDREPTVRFSGFEVESS
jgi:hypothetical protein